MAVQSFLRDLDGLFNYSTDENPTSQQDYQEAVKNWVDTIKSLVDCTLWQPDTEYAAGNVLRTPSLPHELHLTCITAGTSGSAEPDYTDVSLGDTITDGTVTWLVSGYLPLSGGTMTGDIEFYDDLFLGSPADATDPSQKSNFAGLYSNKNDPHKYGGISFVNALVGSSRPQFNISAGDGTHRSFLVGFGDDNPYLTFKSIAISVSAVGSNYIRYDNGLQICWGTTASKTTNAGANTTTTVTFPVAFKDTTYTVTFVDRFGANAWTNHTVSTSTYSTTGVYFYLQNNAGGSYTYTLSWMAVGFWK